MVHTTALHTIVSEVLPCHLCGFYCRIKTALTPLFSPRSFFDRPYLKNPRFIFIRQLFFPNFHPREPTISVGFPNTARPPQTLFNFSLLRRVCVFWTVYVCKLEYSFDDLLNGLWVFHYARVYLAIRA